MHYQITVGRTKAIANTNFELDSYVDDMLRRGVKPEDIKIIPKPMHFVPRSQQTPGSAAAERIARELDEIILTSKD